MSSQPDLRACPFCGCREVLPFRGGKLANPMRDYLQCQGCSASVDGRPFPLLRDDWNRRAPAPDQRALVAEPSTDVRLVRTLIDRAKDLLHGHATDGGMALEDAIAAVEANDVVADSEVEEQLRDQVVKPGEHIQRKCADEAQALIELGAAQDLVAELVFVVHRGEAIR